ncbi:DUF3995 domain-containing protein [Geothrix campi]|uniref:DUF3995 domain-containing protein n=1 Tax=Geothrix campi TaxID=2966450 RepID=UPI002149354F|nr:DUF3995 domain-containing protein [Geothrix sp. SG10]
MIPFLLAATLLSLAGLHFYWAAGGEWGKRVTLPEIQGRPAFTPSPTSTVAVALALIGAACVAILRGYCLLGSFLGSLAHWVAVAIGVVFLLRAIGEFRLVGFFKRIRGTAFAKWDTRLFSPLSLFIALCFFFIAAS